MEKERYQKVVADTQNIAAKLETFANMKIELAEAIIGREFSAEERDDLYFLVIKDNLGSIFEHRPEISPILLANMLQGEEMFSPKHIYFTMKDKCLDHDPTDDDIREHYKERASRFREKFDKIMETELAKKEAEKKELALATTN